MKPTIGRVVHYVSRGSLDGKYPPMHVPLHVVVVYNGSIVDGWTLNPRGQRYEEYVPFDPDEKEPGTWHWPEREDS